MAVDAGTIYSEVRILLDKLSADVKAVDTAFNKIGKASEDVTKQSRSAFQKFGDFFKTNIAAQIVGFNTFVGALRAGFTFLQNFLGDSVKLWEEQQAVIKQNETALKSTGAEAFITSKEMQDLATSLQQVTTFGDETILGAENLLLTFKSIGRDILPEVTERVLDVSTAMGQGLKESAIQLGKALNDPVEGLGALRRVGIQFTQAQEDLIKNFVETGNLGKAQAIILEELNSQFGGSARAAAETGRGIKEQFNNSLGDMQEQIGRAIDRGLNPLTRLFKAATDAIGGSVKAFNDYIDAVQATERGTATIEQRVLVIDEEIKKQQDLKKTYEGALGVGIRLGEALTGHFGDTGKRIDENIASLQKERGELARSLSLNQQGTKASQEEAAKRLKAAEQERALREQRAKEDEKFSALFENTTQGRIAAILAEIDEVKKYAATYKISGAQIDEILENLTQQLSDLVESENNLTEAQKKRIENNKALLTTAGEYQNKLEEIGKTEEEILALKESRAIAAIEQSDADQTAKDLAIQKIKEYYAALRDKKASDAFAENIKVAFTTALDAASQLLGSLEGLFAAQADAQIAELDRALQAQLRAAGVAEETEIERIQRELDEAKAAGDEEVVAEKEKELKRAQITAEFEKKKAEIRYQAELTSWRLTLAQAIAEGARAIINGFATQPFIPAGLIAGGLATALTGVQVATIASSQPQPPQFATGGIVLPSGDSGVTATVADRGGGELLFGTGALGQPLMQGFAELVARQVLGAIAPTGSQKVSLTIVMDSKTLYSKTLEASRNGALLIDARAVVS